MRGKKTVEWKRTGRNAAYTCLHPHLFLLIMTVGTMVYIGFKFAAQSTEQKRPSAATLEHHSVPPENLVDTSFKIDKI